MISNEDFRDHRARQGFAGLQHVGQTKRTMGFKKSESPSDMGIYAKGQRPRERLQSANPTSKASNQARIDRGTDGSNKKRNESFRGMNTMSGV